MSRSNPFSTIFATIDSFTDILNLGRLIFYTAAGLCAIYPLYLIVALPSFSNTKTINFLSSFAKLSTNLFHFWSILPLFWSSLITGFLIATFGFTKIIEPSAKKITKKLKKKIDALKHDNEGLSYHYQYLKNPESVDNYTWLISEYFRFVEIAVFIPIGLIIGLIFLVIYTIFYVFYFGIVQLPMYEINHILSFLFFLSTLIAFLLVYVWPKWWLPNVVEGALKSYIWAKFSLIKSLKDPQLREKISISQ